jgi:tetratricopeptide (TPR) repeat protein
VAAVVAGLCFLTALAAGAVLAWQHFTSPPITADNGARRALMLSYQDHGDDLWCADNFTGARDQYLKALEIAESLAAVQPHGDQEKSDLLSVLRDLGDVHDQLNEVEPALRYHIRARDAAEQWRRSTPDSISALRALAETYLSLGQLDAISDHESKEYLRKAVPLWERLNRDEPGDRDDQHGLMSAYLELAGRHFEDGEKQSSDDLYGKADGLAVSLAATAASVEDKVDVLLFRILALAHRGRHQELADLAEQLHTLGPKDDVTLYNMACCYAQCVPAVAHGRARRDLTDADLKLQEQYADRAVSFLNKSLTAGFSDLKLLLRDPDLKPLRNHTGYRDIVKRVKAVSSASP